MTSATNTTSVEKETLGDPVIFLLTLLALSTYYLSNDNDYQSDKEHGATNHICFWWNSAGGGDVDELREGCDDSGVEVGDDEVIKGE